MPPKATGAPSRPKYPGERHAPQLVRRLPPKFVRGNFIGPGTQIIKRLKRGDQPVTGTDRIAKVHDIDYSLAKNVDDIRRADNRMIGRAKQLQKQRKDFRVNTALGRRGIQGKVVLEKLGMSRSKFASFKKHSPADEKLLRAERRKAVQRGGGVTKRGIPPQFKGCKRNKTNGQFMKKGQR